MRARALAVAFWLLFSGVPVWSGCRALRPPTAAPPTTCPTAVPPELPSGTVSGIVYDAAGPVPGASVRIQATRNEVTTDADGRFTLAGLEDGAAVTVAAWKDGYYVALAGGVESPAAGISLTLRLYQTNDNPAYQWIPPTGESSCASCKAAVTEIWLGDAHSGSAVNPRFLSMYNGTDLQGHRSPLTRYGSSRDYGAFPLRPDPTQPYYGPGYKLDFPQNAGNCAACHVPGAALASPYGTDPNVASGADRYGVHCDFCHKVAAVTLDPATGLPYPNMPGVLSMDVRRPFPEDKDRYQIFFGTFKDDNVPQEDTYLPLTEQSQFCAPCHYGVFWDTVVYNSYGEWLASPYSDPRTGKTCQACHMAAPSVLNGQTLTNVAPGKGGVERDPLTIHPHTRPSMTEPGLLQNAVTLTATARLEGSAVAVHVEVTNDLTGHHVPTDSPLRNMLLVVSARDGQGNALRLLEGPTLPDWAGDYAGAPGRGYAKVLEELWTEVWPSGAYWNHTRVLEDTRLAAFATDASEYRFAAPADGPAAVEARLIYRRAYKQLVDLKGWGTPDIAMEEWRGVVAPQ